MTVLLSELSDGILHLRLNRPRVHNALDDTLIEALHAALDNAGPPARLVCLSGEGKSFCAGADLASMRRQGELSSAENERSALRLAELFARIANLPLPVVARVHGTVVGGGVGLVAAADIAIADETATFALAEVRLGLVPAVISPHVVRKIGPGAARELILTGRKIALAEAFRLGLVQRTATGTTLDETVQEVARELKAGGPRALALAKQLLGAVAQNLHTEAAALGKVTAKYLVEARAGEEGQAGIAAFLERELPPWAEAGSR